MNKTFLIYILFSAAVISGCEDMLQPKIDNSYSSEDTWRLPDKARGVLYNAYAAMGNKVNAYGNNFLDCATDDAVTNDYGSDIYILASGALSPNFNPLDIWSTAYAQFKNINLFLENGLTDSIKYSVVSDDVDLKYKNKYKGEAYFLRAWWGWRLLQVYGGKTASGQVLGYPIVLSSDDGYETRARDTYEDCVDRIIRDLDTAIVYLPKNYSGDDPITGSTGQGRASGYAARVLKSIVYLFAASDAYQPDDVTEGERKFKWIRAAYAADEAIRSGIWQPNYLTVSDFGGANNSVPGEFLLAMSTGNGSALETMNFVPYYYGKAMTNPSQNLADAFPMANGFPITDRDRSLYDENNPYNGRDPRFYMNFYYNGAPFKEGTIEAYNGGRDSYYADTRASRTGYYLRKWIVETVSMKPGATVTAYRYYPLIRKADAWYVFIEAANHAWGPEGTDMGVLRSSLAAFKILREGIGMDNHDYLEEKAAEGEEAFNDLIINERRIEFAFENRRYFDLRRNMRLDEMSEPVYGVDITKTDDGFTYTPKEVEGRYFNDMKYIYAPIPYSEIVKNPLLEQNLGW